VRITAVDSKKENDMNLPINGPDDSKPAWKTPIFEEIPISFEASSYALTDYDRLYS
jgi:coenzyme PQQ precursor peptide PqqA